MLTPDDIRMSDDELLEWSQELCHHNSIFYTIWQVSRIYFSRKIERACICFDRNQRVLGIYINPDFWQRISKETKKFVIMHECLHLFYDHGTRYNNRYSQKDNNIAQDIVINETIVSMGVEKFLIDDWEKYCFISTCFPNRRNVKHNETFEYYLGLIAQEKNSEGSDFGSSDNEPNTLDDHSFDSFDDSTVQDILDAFKANANEADIEEVTQILKDIPGQASQQGSGAGSHSDPIVSFIEEENKKRIRKHKKTWLSLVKELTPYKQKVDINYEESWKTRRVQHSLLDRSLMIPGEEAVEKITKSRYDVVVYIDISGSCANLVDPFYQLLPTFPEEYFNIRTFTFNTNVQEFDWKKRRPTSSGGTSFSCIQYSVEEITRKKRHPDIVFVFTDGDGNCYKAEKPEKWVWVLSKQMTKYIEKGSKIVDMKTFC